jgi:quercetin dioxygenase-like cupin family protein
VVPPEQGKSLSLGGLGVIYKISGEETGGAFAIVEHPIEPGRMVPAHTHSREDECSLVLEGEVGMRVGDQEFSAGPGTYVFKPRGIPHTFWNAGPKPARMLEVISPAGFERYFEEIAGLFANGATPTPDQLGEVRRRYGMQSVDWSQELMAKYNLRLR